MSTMTEIATPSDTPAVLEEQGTQLAQLAAQLKIVDPASFERAVDVHRSLTLYITRVDETFGPIVDSAHRTHKLAVAQRDGLRTPAVELKKVVGRDMAAYEQEVERLRAQAEALAQAERDRLEREETERVEAERLRLQRESDDRTQNAALAAAEVGDVELAERLVSAPPVVLAPAARPVFAPVMAPPPARAAGLSFRDNWKAEVIDLPALVKAVAAGHQPITLLEPNLTALNGMARSLKSALAIPGVRAVNDRGAATKKA